MIMDGDQVVVMVFGSLQTERGGKGKWMSDSEMQADKIGQRGPSAETYSAVIRSRACSKKMF